MKRQLVAYPSSDEDVPASNSQLKKRKLPTLSAAIIVATPVDNPAEHQGRIRCTPHVDGQWAAYIYVTILLDDTRATLRKLLRDVVDDARNDVASLIEIGTEEKKLAEGKSEESKVDGRKRKEKQRELHISLSRPTFLRAHQREDLKRAVKQIAKKHPSFSASFVTFSTLTNDERTRTFLTLEVGAGHPELKELSEQLTPALKAIKQKEFYQDPRFHASFAWTLLKRSRISSASDLESQLQVDTSSQQREHVEEIPDSMIERLRDKYCRTLRETHAGAFQVEEICAKIGKDVFKWKLSG